MKPPLLIQAEQMKVGLGKKISGKEQDIEIRISVCFVILMASRYMLVIFYLIRLTKRMKKHTDDIIYRGFMKRAMV